MKWFVALVFLALAALASTLPVFAQEDQYVRIYTLIQEGNALSEYKKTEALAKYLEAQAALQAFQKGYPDWNPNVVKFRLNFLATKITALSGTAPAPQSATPSEAKAPTTTVVKTVEPLKAAAP